jgi:hypothetical protein
MSKQRVAVLLLEGVISSVDILVVTHVTEIHGIQCRLLMPDSPPGYGPL